MIRAVSKKLVITLALASMVTGSAALAKKNPRFEYVEHPLLSDAPVSGDFLMGNPLARITIVEYASYTCPHCARYHKDVFPMVKKDYIDKGLVRYVLRPFPLNEPALKASMLADCVGEKRGDARYYTFADVLFKSQNKWAFDADYETSLQTIARVGGVSAEEFAACTNNAEREIKILKIKKAGSEELVITHTPYLFVNSSRFDEGLTQKSLKAYLDGLLGDPKMVPPGEPTKKPAKKEKKAEQKAPEEAPADKAPAS